MAVQNQTDNVSYYLFSSIENVVNIDVKTPLNDLIIIDSKASEVETILRKVRNFDHPQFSLLPILVLSNFTSKPTISEGIDGTIKTLNEVLWHVEKIKKINTFNQSLKPIKSTSFEHLTLIKLIRFNLSRGTESIQPILSKSHSSGYFYPILDLFSQDQQLAILELGEKEGLLSSTFHETNYACPQCSDTYLHYREVCSSCQSPNLSFEDLFHHFPCAHIGPESDFKNNEDVYNCPKCKKDLNHIGIDYDKPSLLHSCNNCGNSSQFTPIQALCVSCCSSTPVEDLKKNIIYAYSKTSKAEHIALSGYFEEKTTRYEDTENVVSKITFISMLNHEIKLLELVKTESILFKIHFEKTEEHDFSFNEKQLKNILLVIKEEIKTTDTLSLDHDSDFLILFAETEYNTALNTLKKIVNRLDTLIKDNFEIEVNASIKLCSIQQKTKAVDQLKALDKLSSNG